MVDLRCGEAGAGLKEILKEKAGIIVVRHQALMSEGDSLP